MKFPYQLAGDTLGEVSEVVDLGVSMKPCCDFRNHFMRCTAKAMRALGFISRFARHFRNAEALKLLYVALVRPHLEYASVIWNPVHSKYINMIERVQHKFLRFAARTLGCPMDRVDHDYGPIMASLNIATLEDRRQSADMLFLFKVFNGHFDCPDLVASVSFIAPHRVLRPRPLFVSCLPRYRHYSVDPMNRAMAVANQHFNDIDLFSVSLETFRAMVHRRSGRLRGHES